ncbi:glycosyl hydrolase [Paenibacillus turpanensis]|uniref:glycosyl hydrolase n=1 Tax=Paenibacillus turpanensis TaxID=2689078 RepID=UPI00140BE117|nr:glycosyl hydrolase [Paenibacillus turpanensis]
MLDRNEFLTPSAPYRIHPFWFWNGDMDDEEVARQIDEMADKGIGGFFLCARQGLTIPYLSKAWFEKVRYAITCAERRGMNVWLYDEYPYPSGIAGGEVILHHPEAKHVSLEHRFLRIRAGESASVELPWGKVLSAKAAPIRNGKPDWEQALDLQHYIGNLQADQVFQKTGLTAYTQKRFFTYRTVLQLDWTAPTGGNLPEAQAADEWEIAIFQEKEIEDFKYYGTFVDPCNKAAMETFIRLTHDRYAAEVGEYLGGTVKGMFTDEIGLLGRIPWSKHLAQEFKQRNGYDLLDCLPALLDSSVRDAAKIRYDYYQTIHVLLREAFHVQVHDWCEGREIEYVAEVPAVRMTTQKFSHVPGGDSAHEKLGRSLEWILDKYIANMRANPKMVSSLARQLGRERNLIECFHSVGWSMTLQDARWMIDRMAALGTNFYNFHAFYYTMNALAKHDAPPSQFDQNPYWEHFRKLADYAGRISYVMSEGAADIRIALLDPVTSLWTQMGNPFHGFSSGGGDGADKKRLERLKRDWAELGKKLLQHRFDYDHLDPELLAEASIDEGALVIGKARYDVLLVPPITNMERNAWAKLLAFLEAGGTVVSIGLLPYDVIEDGAPDEQAAMEAFGVTEPPSKWYWQEAEGAASAVRPAPANRRHGQHGRAYFIPAAGANGAGLAWKAAAELLEAVCPRPVTLHAPGEPTCFLMQTRKLGGHTAAVFISNQEGSAHEAVIRMIPELLYRDRGAKLSASGTLRISEWDLETGQLTFLPDAAEDSLPGAGTSTGAGWFIPLKLEPYQARLLVAEWVEADAEAREGFAEAAKARSAITPAGAAAPALWQLDASGPWSIQPQQLNAIRFERFMLSLEGSAQQWPVLAKTIIDQCSDLAEEASFPLRFEQTFGTPMRLSIAYPIACTYHAQFEIESVPERCELLMDGGAISGTWTLAINGKEVDRKTFRQERVYDQYNLVCDITPLLQKSRNELTVKLEARHDADGLVDPLYIRGTFGAAVKEDGTQVMTAVPKEAEAIHGGPAIGFPYYAGTLSYTKAATLAALPSEEAFELRFTNWDEHFHNCAEVLVNGHSLGVRPWTPYRWIGRTEWLREGDNTVEVRVTNTLAGLLDGNAFDYASHTLRPAHQLMR